MQEQGEKAVFFVFLVATAASIGLALLGQSWRWLLTAGLTLEIAGLVQLKISGLFSGAPASSATAEGESRELGDILFRCKLTGFYLVMAGLLAQLLSIWVW